MIVEKLLCRPASKLLEIGQLWRVGEGNLKVVEIGKLLVHYKFGKPNAPRIPTSISSISTLERYMKKNKAVLIPA
jgi:hypothetical protein